MPSNLVGGTGNNWQSLGAAALYGTNTAIGGGGTFARSELDARRMGTPRIPQAEYPDGYLGNVNDRREDRMYDKTKTSINARSYTRGVHHGERINPGDYFWPNNMAPDRGLMYESKGAKTPLLGQLQIPLLVNDGKAPQAEMGATGMMTVINPVRQAQLQHLRPSWR